MSHLTLPGQIVINLTWPQVLNLIQIIQSTVTEHHSRLRALLVLGKNKQLCDNLKQIWNQEGQTQEQDLDLHFATRKNNIMAGIRPSHKEDVKHQVLPTTESQTPANIADEATLWAKSFPDSEAGLVVLSASLNIWIDLEPVVGDSSLPLLWAVTLLFEPQAIALLLKTPCVAAAAPDCCSLEASELTNNRNLLRQLWLQLLNLNQSDNRLPPIEPSARSTKTIPNYREPLESLSQPSPSFESQTESKFFSPSPSQQTYHSDSEANITATPINEVFWQAPIGIICESLDGGILSANPAFYSLTGYTETQLRHLDRRAIAHPEDFARELRLIQQMCSGSARRHTLRKRYLRRDGSFLSAEISLSLIGDQPEDSYLLTFVTDLSDRQRAEQEIQQRREREALLSEISAKIRATFDLDAILQTAVKRLRQALDTDRVVAYQLDRLLPADTPNQPPDRRGLCLAEDVNPLFPSMKGLSFPEDCIPPPYLEAYRCGRLWTVTDTHTAGLTNCHREMLDVVHVRSMMAVAIQRTADTGTGSAVDISPYTPGSPPLWGLLVVHHCRAPRQWTLDEQQLLQAVANQMAIAIEQAHLLQKLQAYAHELEDRVNQRTRSLEQSLKFEQLIRHLTETLRDCLDEHQVLAAAVEALGHTLLADGCYSALFDEHQQALQVASAHFHPSVFLCQPLAGTRFSLENWPAPIRQRLLSGQTCILDIPLNQTVELQQALLPTTEPQVTQGHLEVGTSDCFTGLAMTFLSGEQMLSLLIVPISDSKGLIGILCVFNTTVRQFPPEEIHLVQQVASQCAIAIRRASLYRQEHQQRLSAEYFRLFLEQSTDVFVEYDSSLRYVSINQTGASLLGRPVEEIIGKTNRELVGPNAAAIEEIIQQTIKNRQKVIANHEVFMADGSTRIFETVYAPLTDASGTIHRILSIGSDVTEARQQWQLLQEQNHQLAEINRLKEEFIATTSHELRTPLTAILGFSSVLLEESFGNLNPKQQLYVDRIHTSGEHLLELINDILDLSRLEADRLELEPQMVFIEDICESVLSLIQERISSQGLNFDIQVEPDLECMVTDPRRIKQMLLNLLTNAIKFTPQGTVGLKIYRSRASSNKNNNYTLSFSQMINFVVWDTGIGIDPSDQHRLFFPFSQIDSSLSRKYQGTGLGLVITRKLAELLGGSIVLESERGKGCRFTISLPLHQSSETFAIWHKSLETFHLNKKLPQIIPRWSVD